MDERVLLLNGITDRHWLKEGETLEDVVRQSLEGGVTFLQIREKHMDKEDFLAEAKSIQKICKEYDVPFVVNDAVDIAAEIGADGAHVGQSDLEAGKARELLGDDKYLGVSANTVEDAKRAEKNGADYIGVGAIFPTGSKDDAETVSMDMLKDICQAVSIPVLAIGGITLENMDELKGTGISGISVISAIYGQDDILEGTKVLKEKAERLFG